MSLGFEPQAVHEAQRKLMLQPLGWLGYLIAQRGEVEKGIAYVE